MLDVQIFATLGGTRTDITDYHDAGQALTIKRGRPHELATTDTGTASLTLANDDGRFTPDLASGAYYPNVKRWVPVEILATIDGAQHTRFAGYADLWSTIPTVTGETADTALSCVDRMALDTLRTLESLAREAIMTRSPIAYWDLTVEQTADQVTSLIAGAPALIAKYSGAADGGLEWGGGDQLPADAGPGLRITPALNTAGVPAGGWRLEADYTPPSTYTVVVCYGPPTHDGPLLRLGKAQIDVVGGVPQWPGVLADDSDALALSGGVEIFSVTTAGIVLSSDPTQTVRATAHKPIIQIGGNGTAWAGGSISHVAVLPYFAPNLGGPSRLASILKRLPMPVDQVISELLGMSGAGSASPTILGSAVPVRIPQTSGGSAQDAIDQLAMSGLASYHIAANGTPTWVSYDYLPASLPWPESAEIGPEATYETDYAAYVTDVTTSLPGGGSWTVSDADGLARPSIQIEGLLATDAACRAVANWIVARSSERPRLKGVQIDLLSLDGPDAHHLAGLVVGSRLTIGDLPPQIPSPQKVIVEGITEIVAADNWTLALDLSPDASAAGWFAWGMTWGAAPWKPI